MPQSLANLLVHVVFSTKHRTPWIGAELRDRLDRYIGGIGRDHKCPVLISGGVADHMHVLTVLHPTVALAEWVRVVKAGSSKWVHETFERLGEFQWQAGYGGFAVSASNRDAVIRYIEGQEEHHRTRSFQEEFREMLIRHGIAFDERYVWD